MLAGLKIHLIIPVYKPDRKLFLLMDKLEHQTIRIRNIILINTEKKHFIQFVNGINIADRYPDVKVWHISKREFDHGGTRHGVVMLSDAEICVSMT